jgi:hypothetical protein
MVFNAISLVVMGLSYKIRPPSARGVLGCIFPDIPCPNRIDLSLREGAHPGKDPRSLLGVVVPTRFWPTELSEERRSLMKKWVDAYGEALTQLQLGTQRPCYWFQYRGKSTSDIDESGYASTAQTRFWALTLRAKFEASEGNAKGAVDNLLASCRFGLDVKKRLLMREQLMGIVILTGTFRTGFEVLGRTRMDAHLLRALQERLTELSRYQDIVVDLKGQELETLSALQAIYAPWAGSGGKENTRVLDEVISSFLAGRRKADYGMDLSAEQVYSSVYRYTPAEMANLIRRA